MQRTMKRLVAAAFLALALSVGTVGAGQLMQQPASVASDPGGGSNTGGGG